MKISISGSGGASTILAEVIKNTTELLIGADDTYVYWSDNNSVNSMPINGGNITVLASGLNVPVVDLAINTEAVFWTETLCCASGQTGSIKKVPIAGGNVTLLADGVDAPSTLALDASNVYWTEGAPIGLTEGLGRIAKVPIAGGDVTTVVSGISSDMAPIAGDDANIYIADDWTIKKVPIDGGVVEKLATGDFDIIDIATDGVNVYWIEDPFSTVRKVPVNGGPVVTIASGEGPAGPIRLDSTYVYWMDNSDTIKKVPKSGGTVVTLASNLPYLSDFTVDGINVYFSEQDSGNIKQMSINGGVTSTLAIPGICGPSPFSWNILAFDYLNVFWIEQTDVGKIEKIGGLKSCFSQDVESNATIPNAIAVDGYNVYWTETGSMTIKKSRYSADNVPPIGSIQINGGAAFTKSTTVALTLTAADDSPPIQMCISNAAICAQWTAFATTKSWTLTAGDGTKTVYAWLRDAAGNTSLSPYSASIILDTSAPTDGTVTSTPNVGDQTTLNWGGFTDSGSGIGRYKVVFATSGTPVSCSTGIPVPGYDGISTTCIHTGLISGNIYYYRVCALDNAGNMSTGATAIAKAVPGLPIDVTATPGNAEAFVSFTPPASNGGSPITSYTVTSSPGDFTVSGPASPITVTGLTNGVTYMFTVSATNDVGTGSPSNSSSSVTPTAALIKMVRSGTTYSTIQDAYSDCLSGDILEIRATTFPESPDFNVTLILKGGYNADFTSQTGLTSVRGKVTVNAGGTIAVENLIIN